MSKPEADHEEFYRLISQLEQAAYNHGIDDSHPDMSDEFYFKANKRVMEKKVALMNYMGFPSP